MSGSDTQMPTVAWRMDAGGMLCEAHKQRFPVGHHCPDCHAPTPAALEVAADLVISAPADAIVLPPPPGALTRDEHEVALCGIAQVAGDLGKKGSRMQHAYRIRYLEVAIKAHRAAGELAGVREKSLTLVELERRYRRLRGRSARGTRH